MSISSKQFDLKNFVKIKKNIIFKITILFFFLIIMNKNLYSELLYKINFLQPNEWEFITDKVMGGVSEGSVKFKNYSSGHIAHLTGIVSTENNGGFIQFRKSLQGKYLNNLKYIKITAKGNDKYYYLHLRTSGTILPWQFYQVKFKVEKKFQEIILPLSKFKRSSFFLARNISPKNIKSIGIVAYGEDYSADLYVKEISFFN